MVNELVCQCTRARGAFQQHSLEPRSAGGAGPDPGMTEREGSVGEISWTSR